MNKLICMSAGHRRTLIAGGERQGGQLDEQPSGGGFNKLCLDCKLCVLSLGVNQMCAIISSRVLFCASPCEVVIRNRVHKPCSGSTAAEESSLCSPCLHHPQRGCSRQHAGRHQERVSYPSCQVRSHSHKGAPCCRHCADY